MPDQTTVKSHSLTTEALQAPSSTLSSSVRSSASTLRSTSNTLIENLSGGENDTDIPEDSESRHSIITPSSSRVPSMRNSRNSGQTTLRNSHFSLAEYRQLQCSMSYKNRVNSDTYRRSSTTSSHNDPRISERMSDMLTSFRANEASVSLPDSHSLLHARISELSTNVSCALPHSVEPLAPVDQSSPVLASESTELTATTRITEVSVAALQTRRAFQQMALAMEDEESGDEGDSDSDVRRKSSVTSGGVVRLGAEEYRMFQFRLRQLEELTAEQSSKHIAMEKTIEREVQTRTQKLMETMEKQISMYKQAKELECDREVQRRVSEHFENPRRSHGNSQASSTPRSSAGNSRHSSNPAASFRDSLNKAGVVKDESNSFEKLLHPRRSRKRLEQLKEREESQKREMEQFREFIRTTEMRVLQPQRVDDGMSAVDAEKAKRTFLELNDPLLPESMLLSSPSDLIEVICVLRKSGQEQEMQIEEAKRLVLAAIEARESAEATAREAIELTLKLDAILDEKKSMGKQCPISTSEEFRHASENEHAADWQSDTPSSSSTL